MRYEEKIKAASQRWIKEEPLAPNFNKRDISKYDKDNIVIIGMRRLGKTEYLKYRRELFIKSNSLEGEDKGNIMKLDSSTSENYSDHVSNNTSILFIDFDSPDFSTIDFEKKESKSFEAFNESIIKLLDSKKYKLVLIDEIQRRVDWNHWLKGMIDKYKDIHFVATGSDAISIGIGGESGLDRYKIIKLGPLTYKEYLSISPSLNHNIIDYIDNWVFPTNKLNHDIPMQYQQVYEKQFQTTKSKKTNIMAILKYIYLNPGITLNAKRIIGKVNEEEMASLSPEQFNNILSFLIDSKIIFKLSNMYKKDRSSKRKKYRLYPSNWNLYKISHECKTYDELLNKKPELKGLVFESAVISSVMSSLFEIIEYENIGFYKEKDDVDADLVIGKNVYEIKSYDLISTPHGNDWEKLEKKKHFLTAVIHTGETKVENEINFINVEEFLKGETWKQKIN